MKGSYGLIVAAVLGVLGIVLNWVYLQNKTKDVKSISFLGLKDGVIKQPGERFSSSDFEPVPIPERHAGNLEEYVHLFSDKNSVVGYSPTREYKGGQLVLRDDLKTPPRSIAFTSATQRLFTVKVEPTFEASLYKPGDTIDFIIPVFKPRAQTGDVSAQPPQQAFEIVGPFTIAHIGPRLGSRSAAAASRQPIGRETSVGVFLTAEGDGYDAVSTRLVNLYLGANKPSLDIQMHSPVATSSGS